MSSAENVLSHIAQHLAIDSSSPDWRSFVHRAQIHGPHLHALLYAIYGTRDDFAHQYKSILTTAAQSWLVRSSALKKLDAEREANPRWFQSNQMLGGIAYVDLFAGDLDGIRSKLPYFKELGLTYLHLMPLFEAPEGNSDGGYAVSSYREVNPKLGNMTQLRTLADELRSEGISLCVDFIFNHTSDEHEWAKQALAGDPKYRNFYRIMNRAEADSYDRNLREIFPDQHPGAFTSLTRWTGKPSNEWIWTTFNSFQLDLDYANPEVFNAMAGEMLFLANVGVDVLRMDAVAFIWKQLGTGCENLPEAHLLIQAFNALARMAAPSLLFKSEAIVHPNDVVKYIRPDECQISYNPLLMALLWNTLATREVNLLSQAITQRSKIHSDCAWVNYVRCHDDIGWTFSDEDASLLGINGYAHRQFLNRFYTNRFDGSFARGLPFQENPKTGDCRISGMTASLAGLELAQDKHSPFEIELSIKRVLLIHGITMSYGGIPLLYLGDEIGMTNDYAFKKDLTKAGDSRWVHRPGFDWVAAEDRHNTYTPAGQIFVGLNKMIAARKAQPAFSAPIEAVDSGNAHVLAYAHYHETGPLLVLANFSENPQRITTDMLHKQGLSWPATDLLTGSHVGLDEGVALSPYQLAWLRPA